MFKKKLKKLNGYDLRPKKGKCPSCGANEKKWCSSNCPLLDLLDYR